MRNSILCLLLVTAGCVFAEEEEGCLPKGRTLDHTKCCDKYTPYWTRPPTFGCYIENDRLKEYLADLENKLNQVEAENQILESVVSNCKIFKPWYPAMQKNPAARTLEPSFFGRTQGNFAMQKNPIPSDLPARTLKCKANGWVSNPDDCCDQYIGAPSYPPRYMCLDRDAMQNIYNPGYPLDLVPLPLICKANGWVSNPDDCCNQYIGAPSYPPRYMCLDWDWDAMQKNPAARTIEPSFFARTQGNFAMQKNPVPLDLSLPQPLLRCKDRGWVSNPDLCCHQHSPAFRPNRSNRPPFYLCQQLVDGCLPTGITLDHTECCDKYFGIKTLPPKYLCVMTRDWVPE